MLKSHTKGPWEIGTISGDVVHKYETNTGSYSMEICKCSDAMPLGKTEQEANARLIAAAPELLESLVAMLWILDLNELPAGVGIEKAVDIAKNIVKKATGSVSLETNKAFDNATFIKFQIACERPSKKNNLESPLGDMPNKGEL